MDRKVKVYLDTSVISYLQQEDAPERMKDTLALWAQFEVGKYEICLSQVSLMKWVNVENLKEQYCMSI